MSFRGIEDLSRIRKIQKELIDAFVITESRDEGISISIGMGPYWLYKTEKRYWILKALYHPFEVKTLSWIKRDGRHEFSSLMQKWLKLNGY